MLSWRELRHQLTNLPEIEKFDTLLKWWSKAPICAYSIDAYDCSEWPTPWELLNENMFCTSAIAYMMAQTLILSGFDASRVKLMAIKSSEEERLVMLVDDSIVMNYSYGEVFQWNDILDEFEVRETYVLKGSKFQAI